MTDSNLIKNGISFVASGSAIPEQKISNESLGERVDTSDKWIKSRTGIRERRICTPNESLSELCFNASVSALEMARWDAKSLDLILLATSTPDDLFGTAPKIQALLGAENAVAFDLTAACSGFLFALITASQFIVNGNYKRILVIGADKLSSWVDWDDRTSCVLFGDGAGAVLLESVPSNENSFFGFKMKTDGAKGEFLQLSQKVNSQFLVKDRTFSRGEFDYLSMNGQEVYKFAIKEVPQILEELFSICHIKSEDIDWLLLHQANQRILDSVAERIEIDKNKVLSNLSKYGNTSAATIPLMLDEAVRSGKVQNGDLIASSGFGAGLSWGAALFRWGAFP